MADTADERLALSVEQGALLWCMRLWVVGLHHEVAAATRIRTMIERLGASQAAPCLDEFMLALGGGATRRLAIGCMCQPHLTGDERVLLDVLGLAQHSRPFEALTLLRAVVTETGARAVLRGATRLGTELALAGRFFPAPEDGTLPDGTCSDPGTVWAPGSAASH